MDVSSCWAAHCWESSCPLLGILVVGASSAFDKFLRPDGGRPPLGFLTFRAPSEFWDDLVGTTFAPACFSLLPPGGCRGVAAEGPTLTAPGRRAEGPLLTFPFESPSSLGEAGG